MKNRTLQKTLSRRRCLRLCAGAGAFAAIPVTMPARAAAGIENTAPAEFWEKMSMDRVTCSLCPTGCIIKDGKRSDCLVRVNIKGELRTLNYARPCSLNNDPVEKKPLFHYRPGTLSFSLATAGCNLKCKFCQNWQISQSRPEDIAHRYVTPEQIVQMARHNGSRSIAFTYSEPVVFYEYMRDIAKAAAGTGIGRVMISNGYIEKKPFSELLNNLDAVKIDFKAFSEKFYSEVCAGHLKPVLDSLRLVREKGVWLEMVVLTIPTLNDDPREIEAMCRWIRQQLGADVPLHFTRFHPTYKMRDLPPTPVSTLEKAREIGLNEGLHYVYAGNVPGHSSENTYCHNCGELLIRRVGFRVVDNAISDGRCPKCKKPIPGIWK